MRSASLLVKIEKKIFPVWGHLRDLTPVGDVTSRSVFAFFGQIYTVLGANPVSQCFGSSFVWKLDYHTSL